MRHKTLEHRIKAYRERVWCRTQAAPPRARHPDPRLIPRRPAAHASHPRRRFSFFRFLLRPPRTRDPNGERGDAT